MHATPLRIISWNCNGLTPRIKDNTISMFLNLLEVAKPDLVFLQEVRGSAHCENPHAVAGDTCVRDRSKWRDNTKQYKEDKDMVNKFMASPALQNYSIHYSLADKKYSGSAVLINNRIPKYEAIFTLDEALSESSTGAVHHEEGRIILIRLPGIDVLGTYVPNSGAQQSSWERRDNWEIEILNYLCKRDATIPLVWTGDLNVAPEDSDLSHPQHFKSFGGQNHRPDRAGMPGCQPAERTAFSAFSAYLVDAFTYVNATCPAKTRFSWRSVSRKAGSRTPFGIGMRLDHFLISPSLVEKVQRCRNMGIEDGRGFCGSDHCPILLDLDL